MGQVIKSLASVCQSVSVSVVAATAAIFIPFS